MFDAVKVRNFRYLLSGQLISQFGNAFLSVCALWLLQLRSPDYLVVAGLVTMIPTALAMFGGALVDRLGPWRLMITTDVGRAIGVGAMLVGVVIAPQALPFFLLGALAVTSLGGALFGPAESTIVPEVVPQESLPSANGLLATASQSSGIGYAIGGAALGALGAVPILAFDAFSFVASALSIFLIKVRPKPRTFSGPAFSLSSFKEAFHTLKGLRWFFRFLPVIIGVNVLLNGAFTLFPYWVHHVLLGSAAVYGILVFTWTIGQFVGSLVTGAFSRLSPRLIMAVAATLQGIAFVLFSLWPNAVAEGSLLVFAGIVNGVSNAVFTTMLQRLIPVEMRGRAFGLITSLLTLGNPVGPLLVGATLHILPLAWPWFMGGVLMFGLSFLALTSKELETTSVVGTGDPVQTA